MPTNPFADKEAFMTQQNDGLDFPWFLDKAVALFVFIGGISAIVFIIAIFVFISREGIGFVFNTMDIKEFFLSPA